MTGGANTPFQSTLSVRRATCVVAAPKAIREFQSTLSVRRATLKSNDALWKIEISIHALRKESDIACCGRLSMRRYFNPRSP